MTRQVPVWTKVPEKPSESCSRGDKNEACACFWREVVSRVVRDPSSGAHHSASSTVPDLSRLREVVVLSFLWLARHCIAPDEFGGLCVAALSGRTDFTLRARGCGCLFRRTGRNSQGSHSLIEACDFLQPTLLFIVHSNLLACFAASSAMNSLLWDCPAGPNTEQTSMNEYTRLVIGMPDATFRSVPSFNVRC
jgi:hypothetical protein